MKFMVAITFLMALAIAGWVARIELDRAAQPEATNTVSKVIFTIPTGLYVSGTIGTNAVKQFLNFDFREDKSLSWTAGKVTRREVGRE